MLIFADDIDGEEFIDPSFAAKNTFDETLASNNWVISGKHTASGKPLLANDPHLVASIPSFWTIQNLEFK